MKFGTKLFLLIVAGMLVMCFYNLAKQKSSEPEKTTTPSVNQDQAFDNSKIYINTAPASPIPTSNGSGTLLVSSPSTVPILKGNVRAANLHGFGAVICPDSKAFAAFCDIPTGDSDEESNKTNKRTVSDTATFKRYGCSYFPPDTPIVSEGGDPNGSLVTVKVNLDDGRTISGVTFSTWIAENEQRNGEAAH